MPNNSHITIGKIGRPYGVKGWVHVYSYTEPKAQLFQYPQLQLNTPQKVLHFEAFHNHQTAFVAKIKGIDDRNQAALITNQLIITPRDALAELPADEYYWEDLIGLEVINQAGVHIGQVDHLLALGPHDVFVIKDKQHETLIPYVDQYILKIDLQTKQLHVAWEEI